MKKVLKTKKDYRNLQFSKFDSSDFVLQALSDFNNRVIFKISKKSPKKVKGKKHKDPIKVNKELVKENKEWVKKSFKPKRKLLSLAFFVVNLAVLIGVLFYQKSKFGVTNIKDLIEVGANIHFLWLAMLAFVLIMVFETVRTSVLIYSATKQFKPSVSYKSTAICRYYDSITPFACGGQTFQAFYLNNRGINAGIATSVPMAKYLYNQITFVFISIMVLSFGVSYIRTSNKYILVLSIVGLVLSVISLFVWAFLSLSKKLAPKIIKILINLAAKLKIIKNPKKTFIYIMRYVIEYQKSIKFFAKSWGVYLASILSSVGIILLNALIPFLIYCIFNVPTFNVAVGILTSFFICELAVRYVPMPGGFGVAEISFAALFGTLFSDGVLFWALLMWRIFSYYLYLVQGFGVICYDFIYGNKKNKKKLSGKSKIKLNIK